MQSCAYAKVAGKRQIERRGFNRQEEIIRADAGKRGHALADVPPLSESSSILRLCMKMPIK
jgi:hypothetical protein